VAPYRRASCSHGNARPGDPVSLIADNSALNTLSGSQRCDSETGIRDYVHWYLNSTRTSLLIRVAFTGHRQSSGLTGGGSTLTLMKPCVLNTRRNASPCAVISAADAPNGDVAASARPCPACILRYPSSTTTQEGHLRFAPQALLDRVDREKPIRHSPRTARRCGLCESSVVGDSPSGNRLVPTFRIVTFRVTCSAIRGSG